MVKPAPQVQLCVIGEGGEVVAQLYEDHVTLTIRQHELERFAEVILYEPQLTVLTDLFAQMGTAYEEDDLA